MPFQHVLSSTSCILMDTQNTWGNLLKCKLRFSGSKVGPEILIRSQAMVMLKILQTSDILGNIHLRQRIGNQETAEEKQWPGGISSWQRKPLWNCEISGLDGSAQAALREMGSRRESSRRDIRTLTRAMVVEMEKIGWMWYLGGKTTPMEFPSSATWVQETRGSRESGLFSLTRWTQFCSELPCEGFVSSLQKLEARLGGAH